MVYFCKLIGSRWDEPLRPGRDVADVGRAHTPVPCFNHLCGKEVLPLTLCSLGSEEHGSWPIALLLLPVGVLMVPMKGLPGGPLLGPRGLDLAVAIPV